MAQSRDALVARRRRVDTRIREVHAALNGPDQADVPDAVADALDALYDLWEYWRQAAGLTMNQAGVAPPGRYRRRDRRRARSCPRSENPRT